MEKVWIKRTVALDLNSAELLELVLQKGSKSASALFREKIVEEAIKLGIIGGEDNETS